MADYNITACADLGMGEEEARGFSATMQRLATTMHLAAYPPEQTRGRSSGGMAMG